MSTNASDRSKGGRPRKSQDERKGHRVQVAMSDAELEAARELARLRETSVSAAVASSVSVALQALRFDRFVDRVLAELKTAAVDTARELDGWEGLRKYENAPKPSNMSYLVSGEYGTNFDAWSDSPLVTKYALSTGRALLLVSFAGTQKAYRELQTPLPQVYDDALRLFAVRLAETYREVDRLDVETPYRAASVVVLFGFAVGNAFDRLYYYGEPFGSAGTFAHEP
jgi:hypothetical protein